ncbi:hypothetical protein ACIBCP_30765 [Streptomyces sp. NPDC051287]|uniref:hypothetical protein n=1 Tax=Streptomyces sp. NPDC051287 TaxID=3365648 RepID=UPI0037A0BC9A
MFSFSLLNNPELTEEGLNILSEVVTSPEAAQDPEMEAVAVSFAAWGLSRLELFNRAISVIETALNKLQQYALIQLFLQQQLTVHLADSDDHFAAMRSARKVRSMLDSEDWRSLTLDDPQIEEILSGISQAAESNIHMLKRVTSRSRKLGRVIHMEPNTYWRTRNSVLERGFTSYVSNAFTEKIRVDLARPLSSSVVREHPRQSLLTYLVESELAGHYRRILAARSLLGKQNLADESTDEFSTRSSIHMIRQSRDIRTYENSLRLLMADGPVATLLSEVHRSANNLRWPPRKEDFVALKVAGSLLSKPEAQGALHTLLSMPSGQEVRDLNSIYLSDSYIWPAICSIAPVAGMDTEVARRVRDLALETEDAHTFSQLVAAAGAIDWAQIDLEERESWTSWLNSDKPDDAIFLEQEVAQALGHLGVSTSLLRYASHQNDLQMSEIATLIDFGNAKPGFRLRPEVARNAARVLELELNDLMLDAARGSYSFGVVDSLLLAAMFSSQYEEDSLWRKIEEVLSNPRVDASQKSGVFEWLSRNPDVIPQGFTVRVQEVLDVLEQNDDTLGYGSQFAALRFLCALGLLTEQEVIERITNLATSGSSEDRFEAARTLPFTKDICSAVWMVTVLDMLTRDPSPVVRSMAGASLGSLAAKVGKQWENVRESLKRCLLAEGVWIPLRTLNGIISANNRRSKVDIVPLQDILEKLAAGHADYFVRQAAAKLLHTAN